MVPTGGLFTYLNGGISHVLLWQHAALGRAHILCFCSQMCPSARCGLCVSCHAHPLAARTPLMHPSQLPGHTASSELNTLRIGMLSCAFPIESLPEGRGDPVKVAKVSNKGWLCILLCADKSTNTAKVDNKHGLRSPIVLQPLLLSCSLQKATQRCLCLLNLSRNTLLP